MQSSQVLALTDLIPQKNPSISLIGKQYGNHLRLSISVTVDMTQIKKWHKQKECCNNQASWAYAVARVCFVLLSGCDVLAALKSCLTGSVPEQSRKPYPVPLSQDHMAHP